MDNSVRNKGIIAGVAVLLVFVLICVGLYMLGGDDQAALERLRDIAIIFIVFLMMVTVVLLAGITVALILLFNVLKDKAVPILDETSGTINRIRNTTNFVTEEAVKPIVTVASKYSKVRAMSRVVTGKQKKPPRADV
ncbi:MAG TPA: hypothetical protein VD767_04545 [Thermomicrobiales bacterium]|nr:hypothetical protein [Thermomicrobiales bacterium]